MLDRMLARKPINIHFAFSGENRKLVRPNNAEIGSWFFNSRDPIARIVIVFERRADELLAGGGFL